MKVNVRFENERLKSSDADYARCVRALCELAVMSNRSYLHSHPRTPALYESGVVYQNEPIGLPDELVDIPAIRRKGWGDCLHLVAWRVAELRENGEDAKPRITCKRMKKNVRGKIKNIRMFHVLVRRADGSVECPSRILGM